VVDLPTQADERAVISKAIFDEGRRPIYVYRSTPQAPDDSGWTATVGESPEEIRSSEFLAAHIEHLVDRWPELGKVFADPRRESHWEWDESAAEYREI
jgi:hypothetical protein